MANPNDKKDYIRTSLGLATAQICQGLGWHSVQRSSHDVLTDVLERYLSLVSKRAALVSQTCCRTAPNLDDVVLAFKQLGIQIHELQDYMHQVEPAPSLKCIPKAPIEQNSNCLLDFSGEDFLPPLIDISIKEEEITEEEAEDATPDANDESSKGERPKTITFRTDSVESPPYSPLEPKSLNLNALQNMDLTRPDLKVTTPKGYTPTLTTRPVVATISSLVNSTVRSPLPTERKRTPTPTHSKSTKKEKKESKKTESPQSLLSPPTSTKSKSPSPKLSKKSKPASPSPAALAAKEKEREQKEKEKKEKEQRDRERREKEKREKEQRDREKREQKEREKQEREREKQELKEQKEREKQEREREKQEQKEREKKEREREKERQKQKELELKKDKERQEEEERLAQFEKEREQSDPFDDDPPSSPDRTYLLHAPRRADSPTSTLFSPPRVRIASYQSDKKKPSKDKENREKKDSSKEDKKSKHKKKSSTLSSPASSIGSLKSPPSAKSDLLSPPKLSQPIIKHEKSSNKTVMFPPDSSPDITDSPAKHTFTSPDERKSIKQEEDESPLKISPISLSKHVKKEAKTDVSENEIDVTSFSQGEEAAVPSYSESFQPNMFFPTKFKDEKKKKKKKKSEKDRDEKMRKKEDKEKKKDRKRKLEESPTPSSSSTSTMIPKLTLKMGSEKISDDPPPAKIPKKRAGSPPLSLKTVLKPSTSQIVKKKKEKKKDKHKEKSRDFDDEDDNVSNSGFYVESQTDTAHSYDNKIYYCPGCGKPDDGSPMIGCDKCDDWYHWPCVNIVEEPAEDEKWFCPNCPGGVTKKKKKKKKRDDD